MIAKLLLILTGFIGVFSYSQWFPAVDRIKTHWAENVSVNKVLPEYPRPIMERSEWMNLNGLWEYSIIDKGSHLPQSYDGNILVPLL